MTSEPANPALCPLCGGDNQCSMAQQSDAATAPPCWCMSTTLAPSAVARAEQLDGPKRCICPRCGQSY